MTRTLRNERGFTLIEIMVVVVILALLAALVGPRIMGRSDDAKIADAKVQIRTHGETITFFSRRVNTATTTFAPSVPMGPRGERGRTRISATGICVDGHSTFYVRGSMLKTGL